MTSISSGASMIFKQNRWTGKLSGGCLTGTGNEISVCLICLRRFFRMFTALQRGLNLACVSKKMWSVTTIKEFPPPPPCIWYRELIRLDNQILYLTLYCLPHVFLETLWNIWTTYRQAKPRFGPHSSDGRFGCKRIVDNVMLYLSAAAEIHTSTRPCY